MEQYQKLAGIFTANAQNLKVNYSVEEMTVYFFNWEGKPIMLKFRDVLLYRLGPFLDNAPRNDDAYTVKNSELVESKFKELRAIAASRMSDEDFKLTYVHYKLCFDALDIVVDIVAGEYEVK